MVDVDRRGDGDPFAAHDGGDPVGRGGEPAPGLAAGLGGGGPYTVMQANTRIDNEAAPFAETHGAGLRLIFDLSGVDGTQAIVHTGQSGHPLSPHYSDLADPWASGAYLTVPMSPEAIAAAAPHVLRLTPRREAGTAVRP